MRQSLTPRQVEIMAVATELIAEMGIQQLTMKKVAQRMGFSEPAIYRHFNSKVDILLAILAGFREQSSALLAEVNALTAPAPDKIAAMYGGFTARFVQRPEVTAVIFAEEIFQDDKRLATAVRDIMAANQKTLLNIILAGQQAGEIRDDIPAKELMTVTMGAFRLTVTRWRLAGHAFDLEQEGKTLWSALATLLSGTTANAAISQDRRTP